MAFNGLSDSELERLDILIEEAAEVIQIASKIKRHGYESRNPLVSESLTNREYLEKELGDLKCAKDLMIRAGDLNAVEIDGHAANKRHSIGKWLHHN